MPLAVGGFENSDVRVGAAQADKVYFGNQLTWPHVDPQVNSSTAPGNRTLYFPRHHDEAAVLLIGGGGGGGGAGWVLNGNGGEAGKKSWLSDYLGASCRLRRSPYPEFWVGVNNGIAYCFVPPDYEYIPVTIGSGGSGGGGGAVAGSGSAGSPTTFSAPDMPLYEFDSGSQVWRRSGTANISSSAAGGRNDYMVGTRDGEGVNPSTYSLGSNVIGEGTTLTLHPEASEGQTPGAGGRGGTASSGNGSAGGHGGAYICSYSWITKRNLRRTD